MSPEEFSTELAQPGEFRAITGSYTWLGEKISQQLRDLEPLIKQPNACNSKASEDDIQLFPLLRLLTLVTGIDWPTRVADYRDNITKQTQVNLLFNMVQ